MAFTRIATAGYSGNSGIQLYTEYQVIATNTTSLVSTVRFQLVSYSTGSTSYDNSPSGSDAFLYISDYGTVWSATNPSFDFRSSGYTVWCTCDYTYQHDSNGYRSIVVRGHHTTDPSLSLGTADTYDVSIDLPRITPAASSSYSTMTSGVENFYDTDDLDSTAYHLRIGYSSTTYSGITLIASLPNYKNCIVRGITPTSGGTYNLKLTDSEKEKIYLSTKDSTSVNLTLNWCTYSGSTQKNVDTKTVKVKIKESDNSPQNMTVSLTDINKVTSALTGNSSKLIKGYSNAKLTVTTKPTYAINNQGAIKNYYFNCDDGSETITESTSEISKTYSGVKSSTFSVKATDRRGFSCTNNLTASLIDYSPIAIRNIATNRSNTSVSITVTGGCFYGSFGSRSNTIKTAKYSYKEKGSTTWIDGITTLTSSIISNGTFNCTGNLSESFAENKAYDLRITIEDQLSTSIVETVINQNQPALKINGNLLRLSTENTYFESPTGAVYSLLDFFYPVGCILETSNSANPSTMYGGTWVSYGEGKVIVGAGTGYTVGSTGGEETHTLTKSEMPAHSHRPSKTNGYFYCYIGSGGSDGFQSGSSGKSYESTEEVGGGGAHNNMQPYIVAYRWKRTA